MYVARFSVAMATGDVSDVGTSASMPEVTSSSVAADGAILRCDMPELLATVITLGGVILATIIGNAFVIAAVVLERHLRSHVANYLVASLAVADLLVALLVMPLALVNEVYALFFVCMGCMSVCGTHCPVVTDLTSNHIRPYLRIRGISKLSSEMRCAVV